MTRGEQEQKCLDKVKLLFNSCKILGLDTQDERLFLENTLKEAEANFESSKFPDFLFADVFIEHFQVTSANENRKGSEFRKKQKEFQKKGDEHLKKISEETFQQCSMSFVITSCYLEMESPCSSYENYRKSFEKNWIHHINSRRKYSSEKTCVFLIEFVGDPIIIEKDHKFVDFYRISLDKSILNYVYKFKSDVDYVIFTYSDRCELVSVKQIPDKLIALNDNVNFGMGRQREVNAMFVVDIS